MTIFKKILFLNLFSLICSATLASPLLYHCPNIKNVKYSGGTFSSHTDFKDIRMDWFTTQYFPDARLYLSKFVETNRMNDCIGGICAIHCVYVNNKGNAVWLEVSGQKYRTNGSFGKNWANDECEANKVEDCIFQIIKNVTVNFST